MQTNLEDLEQLQFILFSKVKLTTLRGASHLYLPVDSQLKDFDENDYFNTVEIRNFCVHDSTSPLKGKNVTQDHITSWLRKGSLKGYRNLNYWYVSKKQLVTYFDHRRKIGR